MARASTRTTSTRAKTRHPTVAPSSDNEKPSRLRRFGPWIALGVFIILCAALVYFLTRPAPDYRYNGYVFTKENCPGTTKSCYFATLTINKVPYSIPFYYHPKDVENILFEYNALDMMRTVYATGNGTVIIGVPDGAPGQIGVAGTELSRVLGQRYGILDMHVDARVIGSGADQASCSDADATTMVVAFQQGDTDGVFVRAPNCLIVSATSPDRAVAVADAFVYRLFGIIPTMRPGAKAPAPSATLPTGVPSANASATP